MCSVTKRVELLLEQNDTDNQGNCNVSLLICSGKKKTIVKINLRAHDNNLGAQVYYYYNSITHCHTLYTECLCVCLLPVLVGK